MDGTKKKVKMFLLFCMTILAVTAVARGKPAQAANLPAKEELFDYDDLMPKTENGNGTGKVKDFLSQNVTIDSAGRQYKATNFMRIGDFDVSKPKVKVVTSAYDKSSNPRTINMSEKCDSSDNSPYRYQFFFQVNKLASPNATHWHTEYFQLTSKMIKTCGVSSEGKPMQGGYYNTLQKGTDSTRAERLELKGGSLFPKSRVINSGGAYGMDVYIIDIKPWYLKGKKNYHLMNRNVYVQSVTNHYDASGKVLCHGHTTLDSWWNHSTKLGFAASGKATYYQHYNKHLGLSTEHTLFIHRVGTTEKQPVYGDLTNYIDGKANGTEVKGLAANSAFRLKNIGKLEKREAVKGAYKDSTTGYYFKGIKIVDGKKDVGHFYILDKPNNRKEIQVTGTKGVKTTNYSSANGSGGKKNTIAGVYHVPDNKTAVIDCQKTPKATIKHSKGKPKKYRKFKDGYLTGKKTWKQIVEYVEKCKLKTTSDETRIYLIYAPDVKEPSFTINASFWQSDGNGGYVETGTKSKQGKVKGDQLKKQLNDKAYGNLSSSQIKTLASQHVKPTIVNKEGDGVEYTLKKFRMIYYKYNSKSNKRVKSGTSDWVDLTEKVWDGKTGEAETVGNEALRKLWSSKELKFEGADFRLTEDGKTTAEIELAYYQPMAPSKMKVFLEYDDAASGSHKVQLFSEDYVPTGSFPSKEGIPKVESPVTRVQCYRNVKYEAPSTSTLPAVNPSPGKAVVQGWTEVRRYWTEGDVKGYFGAKKDCVDSNGTVADESGQHPGSLEFKSGFKGRIAVVVFRCIIGPDTSITPGPGASPTPKPPVKAYWSVRYHVGTDLGDGSEIVWQDAGYKDGHIDTSPEKGAAITITSPAKKAGGTIDPPRNKSSSEEHCQSGFGQTAVIKWKKNDATTVRLDVYYVIKLDDPKKKITTKYEETPYEWDDTEGRGTGTSLKNPASTDGESIPVLQGDVQGDSVQELYEVLRDPTIGADGEIMLPNGTKQGGYVPNTLKTESSCTSYLTRGKVTKIKATTEIPVTFHKLYAVAGAGQAKSLRKMTYSTKVKVETIYFRLDKLEIMMPNGSWMYNYAFNEGELDGRTPSRDYYEQMQFNGGDWSWGKYYSHGENGESQFICNLGKEIVYNLGASAVTKEPDAKLLESEASDHLKKRLMDDIIKKFTVESDTLTFRPPAWNASHETGSDVGGSNFSGIYEQEVDDDPSNNNGEEPVEDATGGFDLDGEDKEEGTGGEREVPEDDIIIDKLSYAFRVDCPLLTTSKNFKSEVNPNYKQSGSAYESSLTYGILSNYGLEDLRILAPGSSNRMDLFSKDGIQIQQKKLNTGANGGEPSPDSKLVISYTPILLFKLSDSDRFYSCENVNKVTLHTPIALNVEINRFAEDLVQNTTIHDGNGKPIVLGSPFTLAYDYVGDFSGIYGTVDTKKYALEPDTAYMCFEYESWVKHPDGSIDYHPAWEEYKLHDVKDCTFYAAYWAPEGNQEVRMTVEALNTYESGTSGGILPKKDAREQDANVSRDNYCASSNVATDITGRLFGLRQYDVADYPALQNVFRVGDSYKKTGKVIVSGEKDFLGQPSGGAALFPVVDNDSIDGISYDAYKTGYVVRYNVTTISSLTDQDDTMMIEPTFYWVKRGVGVQEKRPVKLYYDENVNGKNSKLVEVGSETDLSNWKQICIGDRENDVNLECLVDTSRAQGYGEPKDLIQKVEDEWCYGGIMMPANSLVCEGNLYKKWISTASDGTELGIPALVPWTRINRCLQTWYGSYYLPNDIHVRLTSSSIDEQFNKDAAGGYDFEEDYWCNDGFLVVNFSIRTKDGGKEHLSYDATKAAGTCDMWKLEESCKQKWGDWMQLFDFNEGDFIVYDLDASMSNDDYRSGGTH